MANFEVFNVACDEISRFRVSPLGVGSNPKSAGTFRLDCMAQNPFGFEQGTSMGRSKSTAASVRDRRDRFRLVIPNVQIRFLDSLSTKGRDQVTAL